VPISETSCNDENGAISVHHTFLHYWHTHIIRNVAGIRCGIFKKHKHIGDDNINGDDHEMNISGSNINGRDNMSNIIDDINGDDGNTVIGDGNNSDDSSTSITGCNNIYEQHPPKSKIC
ncbi:hypothetical protein WUBG_14465, partial [Wuchereria bancrofti]